MSYEYRTVSCLHRVSLAVAAFLVCCLTVSLPAHAQFGGLPGNEDDVLEEIIVTGQRIDLPGVMNLSVLTAPVGMNMGEFIDNVASIMEAISEELKNIDETDITKACNVQQQTFRSSCLYQAHNAYNLCTGSAVLFGGASTVVSGGTALAVGLLGLSYCADLNYQAQNQCNTHADNFTWPDASPLCQ